MLSVLEIHEQIKRTLQGKLSVNRLVKLIEEQELVIIDNVFKQLDDAFIFSHELVFTLYTSKGVINLARDHTDYGAYRDLEEAFVFHRDDEQYNHDNEELRKQGFSFIGDYHTHPTTEDLIRRRTNKKITFSATIETRVRYERNGRLLRKKERFPTGGDVGFWIRCKKQRESYLVIGSKKREDSGKVSEFDIGAYIPIAEYDFLKDGEKRIFPDGGHSALKPVQNFWQEDTKIDRKEVELYKKILRPVLIIRTKTDNFYSAYLESYFIEIPVRIQN